jgi:S-adenosylmethionine synthetase
VNAADDLEAETVYLTETGLSAEMGDDGNVRRESFHIVRANTTNNAKPTPARRASIECSFS